MKLSTQPYKGARDFYPPDKRLQNYIFSTWREVVEAYGYEEYDSPVVEPTELYRAKTGEEIVNNQIYSFKDRGDRDVTLRPEMTPSVSRMVAGQRQELAYPLRWYSIPNLWRYERPQRGRLREHWQLNVDIFGVATIDAELELIMIANDIMKAFGATSQMYTVRINSRKLTALIMAQYLELNAVQSQMMAKLLDRREKLPPESFTSEAEQIFTAEQRGKGVERLATLLEAKSMADMPEVIRSSQHVKEIQLLFTHLRENNIKNVSFDVSLMRGFDYYTDIVFEIFDTHPDNTRSLFGGGRYDGLVGLFGVEPLPTVGFGMGDVTMSDFLAVHELVPNIVSETDAYMVVIGDILRQAQGVARLLRSEGLNVAVDLTEAAPEKQIKSAVKKQVPFALFVGEQEMSEERFTLKDLATREEQRVSLPEAIKIIKDYRSAS